MASFVYILKCADDSYYIGCTTNLDQRIGEHQAGINPGYTATRLPVECVYAVEFQTIHDAIACERQMKRWSRLKKEAVIRGDWDSLPGLAKRGFGRLPLRPSRRLLCRLLRMTSLGRFSK
jgi:putative endonuclease